MVSVTVLLVEQSQLQWRPMTGITLAVTMRMTTMITQDTAEQSLDASKLPPQQH